ncbi:acyl-CoA dehydrogenase family protein [Microbacterium sp. zg-B96]|uniref:acyl-CoA dehydrogenase family protein n=1 Tax=Microbacterium sp. zg-B96 TaxID=3049069 RepID=UPI00254B3182|nr:acyl-CoA dehydrogenase family protein [Microbacterium sp. zg-B96]WIM15716.1 acyl-CoA dehydrogenase family protein [Microbacterium sp. zg-B96]
MESNIVKIKSYSVHARRTSGEPIAGAPLDFEEPDHLRAIRGAIRELCKGFGDEYWRRHDREHEFPWEFYNAMAQAGWVGIAIPEEYGGGGGGITEASIVLEEVAASGAAMNGASAVHISIFGMNPVVKHGTEEMKRRYLPVVADGSLHVAFGVTEPDAGLDTPSITTRAVREGDQYIVHGQKVWTTKAHIAQKVLLLCRTTPAAEVTRRTDGMTLLLGDLQVPEVDIRLIDKIGRNAVGSCETRYDGLRVDVTDRVGDEGAGFRYILDGLNPERILIAGEAIGIGRAALRKATQYARERRVFGRPIGKNQGISFPLAEAHMRLRAAELAVREASWRYDNGMPCGEQANAAKYLASDAAFFAADRAMQTLGGYAYADEYDVGRYWVESRLMKSAPVPQEMVLNFIAEHVLGLERSY